VFLDGEALYAAQLPGRLLVRNWRPGDRLLEPGHIDAEKIKTLFQDRKVPLWERRHWPVIVAGDELVWARKFGVAAKFIPSAGARKRVRVIYTPFYNLPPR